MATGSFGAADSPGIFADYQVGDIVTLSPGEAQFPAGNKTLTVVNGELLSWAETAGTASSTVVEHLSATRSNELTCYLPIKRINDVTTSNFVRVYRSLMTEGVDAAPDDELFQCYESAYLSAAEITAGYITFTDVAPESAIEVPLYTNPNTGDGSLAANFQPPDALDIAYWQNQMWYLNTTSRHSAELSLIGIGSPAGLQIGDTITIDFADAGPELVYQAATASAGTDFLCFEGGDPGYNIQVTAQALVQCINDDVNNENIYAYYVSSETGAPGKIRLEAVGISDDYEMSIYSSRGTCWTPQLPDFGTPLWAPLLSTNDRHAARLRYSKLGQPEAVPLLNYVQIDADNNPGLRIAALQYRLLVFKTDGIYYLPSSEPYSMQKRSSHVLIAPDSVAKLGDVVYCLTDQGVMAISDAGITPVSVPIDDKWTDLGGAASIANLRTKTVGIAYRSAKQYLCWAIGQDDVGAFSADNSQALVYSTLSSGWTRYTFGARAACIDATTDTIVLAPTDSNSLWQERKSIALSDYADVGGIAINCALVFNDFTEQDPAMVKMAQQCSFLFKRNDINTVNATFASEIHPARVVVALDTPGWGSFPWGEVPWGSPCRRIWRVEPLPPEVAECCQLSVGFTTSQVNAKFSFLGVDVVSRPVTVANR